jgi:hypothetical protein
MSPVRDRCLRLGRIVAALALALAAGCSHQAGATSPESGRTTAPPSCGMNQILLYPRGCKPIPQPFCSAVPPPMARPFCGCDGQTNNWGTTPWEYEGECRGQPRAPAPSPTTP